MRRNKILKNIKIEKIWYGGVWISTFSNGKKIIVKWGVLPESVVDCRVLKNKKDYIECQLLKYVRLPKWLEIIDKTNLCSHNMILEYFWKKWCDVGCWWCKWQIIPYEKQLEFKFEVFKDSFRYIWDNVKDKIENILPSPEIFGYRNKVEFSFWYCNKKEMSEDNSQMITDDELFLSSIGFHRQGRWDQVVDVNQCFLISKKANEIYRYLKNFLKKFWLPNYNQKTHEWVYRHLVIRQGFNTSQFLVNLVIATENNLAKKYKTEIQNLKKTIKDDQFIQRNISTFIITYNNGLADVVKWKDIQIEILQWNGYIFEKLNIQWEDLTFRISPFSFFQTNTLGAQKLFWQAVDYIKAFRSKNGYDYIFDLYCWTWTIWIALLKLGIWKNLIGVELIEEAIRDARINAELNGLKSRSYFVSGKAEKIIFWDENIKSKLERIWLIVVDPPRDGLHKKVVEFLINLKKKYKYDLLYISCNPVTLARDTKMFLDSGLFELKVLRPVDMFPHTHHIENIAFFN